ncbi:MAG: hypothetical protein AB7P01_02810, partial [Bacteroidia bacterium]
NILTNPEVIAINQDKLGEQAKLISTKGKMWVYLKNMEGGKMAIAILNTSDKEKEYKLTTEQLKLEGAWNAYNVWQHQAAGILGPDASGQTGELTGPNSIYLKLQPHETVVLRLEKWVPKVGY